MKKTATSKSSQTSTRPLSERKASANRANAQRSTGPRTPKGKAASSLNALRHGILARAAFNVTIEGQERRAEFEALVAGLAQEFQPRTLSEHLTVQQLAGCYWRLAKVWTFETESAWRGSVGPGMPLEEMKEYEDFNDLNMELMIRRVAAKQDGFFPKAGLGHPTIPTGASARTVLRYQASINAMLFRCLNFLERRCKERMQSDETFEERNYINEPTAEAAAPEPEPEAAAVETAPDNGVEIETLRSAQGDRSDTPRGRLHKRTQKDAADVALSSSAEVTSDLETPAAGALVDPNRRGTA
jgi:hypothetical protein